MTPIEIQNRLRDTCNLLADRWQAGPGETTDPTSRSVRAVMSLLNLIEEIDKGVTVPAPPATKAD